jgi:cytochrome o ubiquinol oxidase subunit II
MKTKFKIVFLILCFIAIGAITFLFISKHNIAVLNPKGMIGAKERDLIFTASLLMLIVVIPVYILTLVFAYKYRENNHSAKHEPDLEHNNIAECCWWGVPFLIIVILAIITWKSSHELNPFKPIKSNKAPIKIQVVALDWKWLFIYPEYKIASVNFVQVPIDTPINFEITADAPMNSFWIPQLGGQIYAMPAMRSKLHLIAHEIGVYRGSSANISGRGFAGMVFNAKVSTDLEFENWVKSIIQRSEKLNFQKYSELVKPSEYVPVSFYQLVDSNLFEKILMKYKYSSNQK